MIAGVPHCSIDGPLLDIQLINQILLSDFRTLNNWSYEKVLILNPVKCHFMPIGKGTYGEDVFYYDNLTFKNANVVEILGVKIDIKLTFHQHNKKMCRKIKN